MPTIVEGTLPAEEFVLHHTLSTVPGLRVTGERLAQSGEKSVMPLVWIRGVDRNTIDHTLDDDSTVESVSWLSTFDDTNHLFQIEWVDRVRHLIEMVTNGKAILLDIQSREDQWYLRVLYPTRKHFSQTHQFATEHGLTFDVTSIRETEGKPDWRLRLTEGQREALMRAVEQGYFDVPRKMNLQRFADDWEVSHQALSERLRRGIGTLIEDTLLVGVEPEQAEELSR